MATAALFLEDSAPIGSGIGLGGLADSVMAQRRYGRCFEASEKLEELGRSAWADEELKY